MSALLLLLGLLFLVLLVLLVLGILCGRKRREGEPPLIKGWIPFIGKALEFGKDAHKFLEEHKRKYGDVFTVQIAGKYMTFITNPLLYPNIIKHGRQLDFHKFSNSAVPFTFGYTPSNKFPGLQEQIKRCFLLLQGDNLTPLTDSMMGNLMLVFRDDYLDKESGWKSASMYEFCNSVMFEATFLTLFGKPTSASRHSGIGMLKNDFVKFDNMFPLLIAQIPIWLLGQTKAIRKRLINYFLPQQMSCWSNTSEFVKTRSEMFEQYDTLRDVDKAARHFTILWASVGNTVPATFWAMYYLVSHPEALQFVRQELEDVLRLSGVEFSRDKNVTLTQEHLKKLLYMESAIEESLRLSSSSMNIRVALEDFSLCLDTEYSMAVRKEDIITLYPKTMHLDPEIYKDPETFQFDRYIKDGQKKTNFYKDGQKLKHYLMPFGSGATMCPGRFFAINEVKQFLCVLLLYLDLQLEEGQSRATLDSSRAGLGILKPAKDIHFRYKLRSI